MDKLRRSFRSSFRRKDGAGGGGGGGKEEPGGGGGGGTRQWPQDEASVKANTCTFEVKYLGTVEVFESRGMQVCEEAVKLLKNGKRKPIKGTLHISGDGLRVADSETKGLVLDQTIEKVSFCAPDRNFERGFSYICRDGTTRRWMCHAFMALKDSGERLSHAVGCAFAICLERKQRRDKECSVEMQFCNQENTFTRFGSFKQGSISERLADPQGFRPADNAVPAPKAPIQNPSAIARPRASDLMYVRQASFRGLSQLSGSSPFKRQASLRLEELPSNLARMGLERAGSEIVAAFSPISEDKESVGEIASKLDLLAVDPLIGVDGPLSLPACLSPSPHPAAGRSPLPPLLENPASPTSPPPPSFKPPSPPPPAEPAVNPWDLVPDQPRLHQQGNTKESNNKGASITVASPSPSLMNSILQNSEAISGLEGPLIDSWPGVAAPLQPSRPPSLAASRNAMSLDYPPSSHYPSMEQPWYPSLEPQKNYSSLERPPSSSSSHSNTSRLSSAIMEDPFDAEWANLATRNNVKRGTNPFMTDARVTAFELQM